MASRIWQAFRTSLLVAVVCGCASTQQSTTNVSQLSSEVAPEFRPPADKARIYVVRRKKLMGAAIGIRVSDTGRNIGKIGPGGVLSWDRDPGEAVIGASSSNESNLTITAKSGEVYFIEVKPNWGAGFNTAASEMRLLSIDEGQYWVRQLRPKGK